MARHHNSTGSRLLTIFTVLAVLLSMAGAVPAQESENSEEAVEPGIGAVTDAFNHTGDFTIDGRIGIGTDSPIEDIEIESPVPGIVYRTTSPGHIWWQDLILGGFGYGIYNENRPPTGGSGAAIFEIDAVAPVGALVLDSGLNTMSQQLNVVSDDAGLTIHNTSPTPAVRELFELISNGGAQFVFTDSDTGNEWQFSQNGNGNFTVSRKGSAGPDTGNQGAELLIAKNGRVKMGPGGDTTFDLLANGNLTITGALTENSDLYAKTGISGIDAGAVLQAVVGLPIAEWSYSDDPGIRHVGPMAQDFYGAFGLGADETGIATLDTSGVALASIQALHAENEALQTQVTWMMWMLGILILGWGVAAVRTRRYPTT